MKTVDLVIGKWEFIFDYYGLPPITGVRHYKGECPNCGKRGKYRCDDKNGTGSWICSCGSGNGWSILTIATGKDFKTLAKELDELFDNTYKPDVVRKQPKDNGKSEAMSRARSSSKVKGSNVEAYLNLRGIYEMPNKAVFASNGNMFALAVDHNGAPVYSHETMLDGDKKANTDITKKLKKLVGETVFVDQAVIRLFDVASTLGIAEGIETALSCRQIYKCAVWSTMNSGFMKKFLAPPGVAHLIIFADNDSNGTGLAAAFSCGERNIKSKNDVATVTIRWTGERGDFNDMLVKGSQVYEWKLSKG